MTVSEKDASPPPIEWIYMNQSPIQPKNSKITFPDGVFFFDILDPGEQAHWSLDLVNTWTMVSRYEPRTPIPGRKPHPESLHEEKDIHHLKSTTVGADPCVAHIPAQLMEEFEGEIRGDILRENPEFWFQRGETCHFVASNAMLVSRVMYMLKDTVGRDFVNDFKDIDMNEYFPDGGVPMTDGGDSDQETELTEDELDRVIPEAIMDQDEVINLTTGEVMSFEEAEARLEDQREELEQWLEQQRED
ncbi:hypothetical protein [Halomontanus rarus]|uniref:hypothetical protein n=1 Tax=Halomontanus rarus TaxID=3034020 RepID=UPI001A98806A